MPENVMSFCEQCPDGLDSSDKYSTYSLRYVSHINWAICANFPTYLLANVSLNSIVPHIPVSNIQSIASAHNIKISRDVESNKNALVECFKNHHCSECNSHLSIFSVELKKLCKKPIVNFFGGEFTEELQCA